jgi:hypothetical protein
MGLWHLENIGDHQHGYRYPDQRSNYNSANKQDAEFYITLSVKQFWYGVQRVKIVVYRYEREITELYGNGMCQHQRPVPENKYPEKVGQQPK